MRIRGAYLVGASALALLTTSGAALAQGTTAAEPQEEIAEEEEPVITVSGFRASLETANAIKKESNEIVDSIVAEDIGKLPDSTGAETLARVPGVSVERLTGEAAAIRVRGLPDLATTYNGRELFTAEGRFVALQDFPSGTISRFDVYKTSAANLLEAGIAGLVDVRSRKPFDFSDGRIAGGITGLHWQNSQRFGVEANLLLSKRFDTGIGEIGILIEGSYTDNKFQDDHRTNSNTHQISPATIGGVPVAQGGQPNPFAGKIFPAVLTLQPDVSNRFRPAGGAAIQWRPSANLEIYSDFLFQGFRGRGRGYGLQINAGTNAILSDVTICPGHTLLICSMTATGGNAPTSYMAGQFSQTDTYQVGAGFIWKAGGGARITGDVAFTDSTFTSTNFQANMITTTTPTRKFQFDTEDGGGTAQILNADGTLFDLINPANWRYSGFAQSNSRNHGRSYQAKLDADIPVELGIFDKIQVGLRFNDRAADSEAVAANAAGQSVTAGTIGNVPGALLSNAPLALQLVEPGYHDDPTAHARVWVQPTRQDVIHYADYLRALATETQVRASGMPARAPNYQSSEKSYTAYVQTHYKIETGGQIEIDGQIGLRAVRTENDINGLQTIVRRITNPNAPPATIDVRETTAVSKQKRYDDFLPNVSARIKFTPELQARLAFTKTRTRPTFGQLNPTVTYDTRNSPATASSGNPELEPIKSTNYDASLEYYFSRSGSATIQVFQRDVIGFINNRSETFTDPTLGPVTLTQTENGEEGRIRGVEVGFRTFLNIPSLPEWARNFGVLGNYTYLDHWAVLPLAVSSGVNATLPGRQPITNTSNHIVNGQVFYENKKVSLRVSYNWRSAYRFYVQTVAAVGTVPTFENARGALDLSAGINPTENISLTFNVANVLGDPARNFRQYDRTGLTYPWQVRYLETIYRLGARFRF